MSNEQFHEALFYETKPESSVRCLLCPHLCRIEPDKTGFCEIRKNIDGTLYALQYGRVSSAQLDPIEKKPLFNFFPGSTIFSIGALGCNLRCPWCQNWSISQPCDSFAGESIESAIHNHTEPVTSNQIVELAVKHRPQRCIGVAFTYNEPFICYEFVKDVAVLVKEAGMQNVLVTNGYVMPQPLIELLPYIDAMNIDIKGFSESFYKRIDGHLRPVLLTAEKAKESCHIELTNLLIPGMNDSREEIERLVEWIDSALGPDTPLHFSRYFPMYKMDTSETPLQTLRMAEAIAKEKLEYVYVGNI